MAERSLAVLPFENLSQDPANAYFANGIHDDVLVSLSKIRDLKVISRDSVMPYKGGNHDLAQIATVLGIKNVLEGNVRRSGSRARVNVRLIDATNNRQLWADNYDREITDAFSLQSELALQIASALKAKLSAAETAQLKRPPTENGEAYLLYIQANDLFASYEKRRPDLEKAEQLYQRAIGLDPKFALAYAQLSHLQVIYNSWIGFDAARREKARANAREALRLQADLPEAHVALGHDYYQGGVLVGEREFEKALQEFEIAQRSLPNDPEIYGAIARVQRCQGKWIQAIENFEKAAALDPNSPERWHRLFYTYELTRNFPAAEKALDRAIALSPNSWPFQLHRAHLSILWKGDAGALAHLRMPTGSSPEDLHIEDRFAAALFLRRYSEAENLLKNAGDAIVVSVLPVPKTFLLGRLYFQKGETARARDYFEKARPVVERLAQDKPRNSDARFMLAEVYAGLGQKNDAIREGTQGAEIFPESQDAFQGPLASESLAEIYAMVGRPDLALPILEHLLKVPSFVSIPKFRIAPAWDSRRHDPRFLKLIGQG